MNETIDPLDHDLLGIDLKLMEIQKKYWERRCLLAEELIFKPNCLLFKPIYNDWLKLRENPKFNKT